jgi:hypothetical protein
MCNNNYDITYFLAICVNTLLWSGHSWVTSTSLHLPLVWSQYRASLLECSGNCSTDTQEIANNFQKDHVKIKVAVKCHEKSVQFKTAQSRHEVSEFSRVQGRLVSSECSAWKSRGQWVQYCDQQCHSEVMRGQRADFKSISGCSRWASNCFKYWQWS